MSPTWPFAKLSTRIARVCVRTNFTEQLRRTDPACAVVECGLEYSVHTDNAMPFRPHCVALDEARRRGERWALACLEREWRRERQVGHGRVLAVPVPPQVDLALERLVAQAASERLVTGVLAHVGDEIRRLAERFAAHDALVRLLSCYPTK